MSFMDRFLGTMRLNMPEDDELLEEEEVEVYAKPTKKVKSVAQQSGRRTYETEESAEPEEEELVEEKPKKVSKVVPMRNSSPKQSAVCMVVPHADEDANEVADLLLQGKSVVLNLEGMNVDAAQRVIDFASGACYVMGGNLQMISKKIFIVTPSTVELSGEFTNLLGDTIALSTLHLNV